MKNPIRVLRSAVGSLRLPDVARSPVFPLMAVAGLGGIAALVVFLPDGASKAGPSKRNGTAFRSGEASSERSNNHARQIDPAQALGQLSTLGKGNDRDSRIRDLLFKWAAQDAEAALSWASALEDPAARRSARSAVCLAVAEQDPHRAVMLALAPGAEEEDGGLLECLTMQWCEKDPKTVLDWAGGQPPGEWRERLLARVSFVLSKTDPAAAAQLVSGLEPGHLQNEAAMAVLHQWALKDSSTALEWAEGFSEPILRERALAEISNLRASALRHEVE
jgi:hypothetical protein